MEDTCGSVLKVVSRPKKGHGIIEWTIEEFRLHRHSKTVLHSPKLPLKDCGCATSPASWYLSVTPNDPKSHTPSTGIYLEMADHGTANVHFELSISVLLPKTGVWEEILRDKDGKIFEKKTASHGSWGVYNRLQHKTLFAKSSKYLSDSGSLSVKAEIDFFVADMNITAMDHLIVTPTKKPPVAQLGAQPDQARNNPRIFTIVSSDGMEFPAHGIVLEDHPSVVAAMLRFGTKNSADQLILPDVDGKTLAVVVDFLCSGRATKLEEVAEQVLEAAIKYRMEDLQKLVVDHLVRNVNVENAGRLLVTANQRGLDILENAASTLIASNPSEVMNTDGWQKVIESPNGKDLLAKVLRSVQSKVPRKVLVSERSPY